MTDYTTGHCEYKKQAGGCPHHNLQCGWPNCDRRLVEPNPQPAASVSERARALMAAEYRTHGWHEDAGRLCMGGEVTSFVEDDALRVIDRLIEQGDEDNHVITELGRLLAGIAVILKGPEPAGTAWSYHDLPELVASSLSEPRQVAAEMKAWAHTKMAEQQSSRRDRMMVSEWAKRLLPESSFPIKDFDVEGMSITKEAAREAVKRVALKQALTQQRGEPVAWRYVHVIDGDSGSWQPMENLTPAYRKRLTDDGCEFEFAYAATTPQPIADAVRELQDEVDRLNAIVNTPQSNDFLRAVSTEAEHQRQRWGSDHDAGKAPADWFWLVGYLAGKALHAHAAGDTAKAEHHIITTAAALANWHLAAFGKTDMRPGIDGESLLGRGE